MDFVQWLEEEGGYVHPSLNLFHSFEAGKRGVLATKAIEEGQYLILVPSHATLSSTQVKG